MSVDEISFMKLAIREARKCTPEDERIHPFVGAVAVRHGKVIGSSYRGESFPGDHAECSLLVKKLANEKLAGCTVYTTLEPCTERNPPNIACTKHLIGRRVSRVVIGMLDPDQKITGQGILRLRNAGISVDLFPPNLMSELEDLNREFIRDRETQRSRKVIGIEEAGITAFYASRAHYGRYRANTSTIDKYISSAQSSAIFVSINLMTGIAFADLCSCIIKKIQDSNGDYSTTISLLDPKKNELLSAAAPILNSTAGKLGQDIRVSLKALLTAKKTLPGSLRGSIEVRVHRVLPGASAILLDHGSPNGRIQLETKPYKAGIQKSYAFEVKRVGDDCLYNTLADAYLSIIDEGRSISQRYLE